MDLNVCDFEICDLRMKSAFDQEIKTKEMAVLSVFFKLSIELLVSIIDLPLYTLIVLAHHYVFLFIYDTYLFLSGKKIGHLHSKNTGM